jgi:IMP dehydrogenase
MKTVQRILDEKNGYLLRQPDTLVYDALKQMRKDIGALLVLKDGKLAGIFTGRDYAQGHLASKSS